MGLFDRFKKQDCEICGKEVGMFGYKKLEDGEICKDCVKLLSPWFSDRRHSTVESIKAQIAYREENKKAVAAFKATKVIGKTVKVHIDETAGKFMVVRTNDIAAENPDVIDISAVTGCEADIRETTQEIMRTVDGKQESYDPPRYKYLYDFDMIITVNHPYFDEIRYNLSPFQVTINPNSGFGLMSRSINPRSNREYMEYENMGEEIRNALLKPPVARGGAVDPIDKLIGQIRRAPNRESLKMLEETAVRMSMVSPREGLDQEIVNAAAEAMVRLDHEEAGLPYRPLSENPAPAEPTAGGPKFCPECGAATEGGKFCPECGTKLF